MLNYTRSLTTPVEPGNVVVHNNVYPLTRTTGTRGCSTGTKGRDDTLDVCPCAWAPEFAEHGYEIGSELP